MDISIIEKILSGSATKAEEQVFENWVKHSPENKKHFEQMQLIWEKSNRIPQTISFDENAAKAKIQSKMQQRRQASQRLRRIWISSAASVLLLLGIGTTVLKQTGVIWPQMVEYTSQDDQNEIELPDGTRVWLNSNSTLTAPVHFTAHKRNVTLKGEAYFEVARDESRPFRIATGNTFTKVLGTSFNIKEDTLQGNVSIIVNTGKVAFYSKNGDKSVLLIAGDRAGYDNRELVKDQNTDLNYLAWKTHILTFKDTPLDEVCRVLSDYYKLPVFTGLQNPDLVLTGTFENESIENILSTIELTLDVDIRQTDNSFELIR